MSTTAQSIADQINNFDFYYEMSDSNSKWDKGRRSETNIKSGLTQMSEAELIDVKSLLTVSGSSVNRYFAKFFSELPTTSPESANKEERGEQDTDEQKAPTEAKRESYRVKIFRNAWMLFRKGLFQSFGAALSASWTRHKLIEKLRNGIAYFSFKKTTGEMRDAIGTLAGNNFKYQAKGHRQTDKPEIIKYWDIEKRAFRSCRLDRFVSQS